MPHRESSLANAIFELSEAADAAALEPDRWADFVTLLGLKTRDSKIFFTRLNKETSRNVAFQASGIGDDTLRAYAGHYVGLSPWRDAMLRASTQRTTWSEHILPQRSLRRTEFYNGLLRPEGGMDAATGLSLIRRPGHATVLAVCYDSRRGEEMHRSVSMLLHRIAGRVRRSLEVNRVLAQATPRFPGDVSLLHALEAPALIVTMAGKVLASNSALSDLLGFTDAISIGAGDQLRFSSPAIQARFFDYLSHHDRLGGYDPPPEDLILPHPETPMAISILPLAGTPREASGVAALFPASASFLVILRPHGRADAVGEEPWQRLMMAEYRLTQAEIRLVLALERGHRLGDFAAANGLSMHTVRSHLRSIFSKTNTHRQHELVALTARLRR